MFDAEKAAATAGRPAVKFALWLNDDRRWGLNLRSGEGPALYDTAEEAEEARLADYVTPEIAEVKVFTAASVMEPVVGPGSAAWAIGDAGSHQEWVDTMTRSHFVATATIDQLAEEVLRATGSGPRLYWGSGDHPAGRLVRVDWRDRFFGYFRDAQTALLYVLEHERIFAANGVDAAELHCVRARCRTESEAVARMDEEDGVVREDPNRNTPKFAYKGR
jgi:hypothetical protein